MPKTKAQQQARPRPNSHLQPSTITSLLPVLAQAEAFLLPRKRPSAACPSKLACGCDHAPDKLPLARPFQHGQTRSTPSLCPRCTSYILPHERRTLLTLPRISPASTHSKRQPIFCAISCQSRTALSLSFVSYKLSLLPQQPLLHLHMTRLLLFLHTTDHPTPCETIRTSSSLTSQACVHGSN